MSATSTAAMRACLMAGVVVTGTVLAAQQPPVPRPFPQPGQVSSPGSPAKPADPVDVPRQAPPINAQAGVPQSAAIAAGRPTDADLGAPIYPSAEFLNSFDAGRGQRYYLFGTNAPYAEIVAYYKKALGGGRELMKVPPMQQFDLPGKYKEETMAYPPSVVVKDYTWKDPDGLVTEGYLVIDHGQDKRYKTVIQIVPASIR